MMKLVRSFLGLRTGGMGWFFPAQPPLPQQPLGRRAVQDTVGATPQLAATVSVARPTLFTLADTSTSSTPTTF